MTTSDPPPRPVVPAAGPGAAIPARRAGGGRALAVGLACVRGGPLFILAVLVVAMALASPYFLTGRNVQNLGAQTSIIAALAIGQLLVIVARGVDISVGSVVALSAVVGVALAPSSDVGIVLAMLGTGCLLGALNGVLIVKGRLPQPLIVTLATLGIARGVAYIVSDGQPVAGLPDVVVAAGASFVGPLPLPVLLVGAAAVALHLLTARTRWGRWLYAVGENPDAAVRLGVPVQGVVLTAYVLCGLTAGFAGLLTAGRTDTATPLAGTLLELDAITAVVIGGASLFGGRGTIVNALIGALILGVIRNGLDLLDVSPFYQSVAIGTIILVALELDVLRSKLEQRMRVAQARLRA